MNNYFGKHIYIQKAGGVFSHHGLGIDDGRIIHYSGLANALATEGVIEIVSIDDFSQGRPIFVKAHTEILYSGIQLIQRACSRLGERQYHILHNNCEHFVNWCLSGKHKSRQADKAKIIYSMAIGARVLWGVKNPAGFVLGAAAGYAYLNYQGLKRRHNVQVLEEKHQ